MANPQVLRCSPAQAGPGSRIYIYGRALSSAEVRIGQRVAEVIEGNDDYILAVVPPGHAISGKADVEVLTPTGLARLEQAVDILKHWKPDAGWFTFSNPINYLLVPSQLDQKYLVLMALPSDQSLPDGKTAATLRDDLAAKLNGPDPCVSGFWQEASYGKTSFLYDISDAVIPLNETWDEIYFGGGFVLQGTGATYPVVWLGTETLTITRENGFSVTVQFPAGNQSLDSVIQTIADAVRAVISAGWEGGSVWAKQYLHQLRVISTDPGPQTLVTVEGTAVSALGLGSPTTIAGSDPVDKSDAVLKEALDAHFTNKSPAELEALFTGQNGYRGVILSFSGNDTLIDPSHAGTFPEHISGADPSTPVKVDLSVVWTDWTVSWFVLAHEIGHNLGGMPDLYSKDSRFIGTQLDGWDIMCGCADSHPTAWVKAWWTGNSPEDASDPGSGLCDPWMPTTEIATLLPPSANGNRDVEVLLLPTSCKMPSVNPFATDPNYANLPLVHAIHVPFGPNHSYYVEARHKGPFTHPTLGSANYDTSIPQNGVIVTEAVNDTSPIEVYRVNVCLLTSQPLQKAGDEYVKPLEGASKIKVRCLEVIKGNPSVYRVAVSWGPGSFFDLRITPWNPPPYESPDIWVDSEENGWGVYTHSDAALNPDVLGNPVGNGDRLQVGKQCKIFARVWNDGDKVAKNVTVDFSIIVPAGTGPGIPIGPPVTIQEIPAGSSKVTDGLLWTPKSANEGHVCIQASINYQDGELNANNNMAQENLTDWYLEGGSAYTPVEFPFQVQNPLLRRAHIRLRARGLVPWYFVDAKPVDFWLDPGEIKHGFARIRTSGYPVHLPTIPASPCISLEWLVHLGCWWAPFGGVSGWAYAVRKSTLGIHVRPRLTAYHPRERLVYLSAQTAVGPISKTPVRVCLLDRSRNAIMTARGVTGVDGRFETAIWLPPERGLTEQYEAEALLLPTEHTGRAEASVKFMFG